MLNYIIKRHRKMTVEKPVELLDGKTPVQEPPKENEIKAIVAGFPWLFISFMYGYTLTVL